MLQSVNPVRLQCELITTEAGIEALAGEWRALHARIGRSPFSDYDLFTIWWNTIGKSEGGRIPHVVAGYENGKLAGVLPLTVTHRAGMRIMQAAGYRAYNYCDMLAGDTAQAVELWQAARQSPHYDFADIRDVYPESLCYEALSSFACCRDLSDTYFLRFKWPSRKDWLASLNAHVRGNFTRCVRRLEEKGPIKFEACFGQKPPAAIVDDMVRQKVAWSIRNKKHGLFKHPDVLTYFERLVETTSERGSMFLGWLTCAGQAIAYNQGFVHHGVLHSILWTYDPDWGKFSPGNVALVNSIMWAIDQGLSGLDLRQGESQFKRLHANEKRQCAEFTFNSSLRGCGIEKAYMMARGLMRIVKGNAELKALKED